ncbi:MAG: LPS export ABC transporter periplasmic protein LptC [Pseudomonadales bacterium]
MIETLLKNTRLRYRAISVLLTLYFGALALNYSVDVDKQITEPQLSINEPDLYMEDASISQINKAGRRTSIISAKKFTHYPLTDVTTLQLPSVQLLDVGTQSPWSISSLEGRLLGVSEYREEAVELWKAVTAERISRDGTTRLLTETLSVFPNQNLAESNSAVTILTRDTKTTAAGVRAFFDKDLFIFRSNGERRVVTTVTMRR